MIISIGSLIETIVEAEATSQNAAILLTETEVTKLKEVIMMRETIGSGAILMEEKTKIDQISEETMIEILTMEEITGFSKKSTDKMYLESNKKRMCHMVS